MINITELYDIMKNQIDGYVKFVHGSNEIVVRCPYCGDSVKHQNKGHFYIGESIGNVFMYNCKRAECGASGAINKRVLEDLGIFDLDLFTEIISINNRSNKNSIKIANSDLNIKYDFYRYSDKYHHKIDYLKSRLYDIDEIDFNRYRIILSPKDFIEYYKVKLNDYQKSIIDNLEKNAVAFLNMNSSCLVFRYIDKNPKYRYFKLQLNKETDIYSIKNTIDFYDKREIVINFAEGAFDIINIRNRIRKDDNEFYFSVNGSDYINKVEYISKLFGLVNFNINIFRDSDKPVELILKQFDNSIFKNNIKIYSNILGKDYSEDNLHIIKNY